MIVLLLCAVPWAVLPACGWYWPIMGFLPPPSGCPNICGGPSLPPPNDAMLPGTFQWGYPPIDHAKLSYPGCAYGPDAFRGSLSFGSGLPFGVSRPAHYAPHGPAQGEEGAPSANRTETHTGGANNTTATRGNTTDRGISGSGSGQVAGQGILGSDNRTGGPGNLAGWLSSR